MDLATSVSGETGKTPDIRTDSVGHSTELRVDSVGHSTELRVDSVGETLGTVSVYGNKTG